MKNIRTTISICFIAIVLLLLPISSSGQLSQTYLGAGSQYGVPAKSLDNFISAYFFEIDNYWQDLYGVKLGANLLQSTASQQNFLQGQIYLGGLVKTDTYEQAFPFFSYGIGATLSPNSRSFMTYGELGYSFYGLNISVSLMILEKELYQTIKFAYSYSFDLFY